MGRSTSTFKHTMNPADVKLGDTLFVKCSQREGDSVLKVIIAE